MSSSADDVEAGSLDNDDIISTTSWHSSTNIDDHILHCKFAA